MSRVQIGVEGMTCSACSSRVERGLKKLDAVDDAVVNLAAERATISFDEDEIGVGELTDHIRSLGYEPVVETVEIGVRGMTCANCSGRVERALRNLDGVVSASVNLASERATIELAPATIGMSDLADAIRDAGYEPVIAAGASELTSSEEASRDDEERRLRGALVLAAVFSVPLFIVSMVPMFAFPIALALSIRLGKKSTALTNCMKAWSFTPWCACPTRGCPNLI